MPAFKNIAQSQVGLVKSSGLQSGRALVPPGEVFECDEALVEHHLKRGRVRLMTEADLLEHKRKGGKVAQLDNWYH